VPFFHWLDEYTDTLPAVYLLTTLLLAAVAFAVVEKPGYNPILIRRISIIAYTGYMLQALTKLRSPRPFVLSRRRLVGVRPFCFLYRRSWEQKLIEKSWASLSS